MHLPIRNGFSWKGNRYLPNDPYGSLHNFSNDDNMEDWDFYYNSSYNNSTIKANASKEMVLIGNKTLYRISKDGKKQAPAQATMPHTHTKRVSSRDNFLCVISKVCSDDEDDNSNKG